MSFFLRRASWFTVHAGSDGLRSSSTVDASALRPSCFSSRATCLRSSTKSASSAAYSRSSASSRSSGTFLLDTGAFSPA